MAITDSVPRRHALNGYPSQLECPPMRGQRAESFAVLSLRVLALSFTNPEGVAYDPDAGVVWAGGEAGQLYRVEPDAAHAEQVAARARVRARPRGRRRAAAAGALRLADGSLCVYDGDDGPARARGRRRAARAAELPRVRARRDALPERLGDLGARRRPAHPALGATATAPTSRASVPCFTNGLAVSPDGRWLCVVESYEPRLSRHRPAGRRARRARAHASTAPSSTASRSPPTAGCSSPATGPTASTTSTATAASRSLAEDPQGTLLSAPTNVCFIGPELDAWSAPTSGAGI